MLEFEDVSYYLQYNARNEFFQSNIFKPNVECMDKQCLQNQKHILDNKIDSIKARKETISARKALRAQEFVVDDEEAKKWEIDIIEDSGVGKEAESIDTTKRDEVTMEQLMAQMQQL